MTRGAVLTRKIRDTSRRRRGPSDVPLGQLVRELRGAVDGFWSVRGGRPQPQPFDFRRRAA